MNKPSIRIIPLRSDFLEKVRAYGIDDQNQPVVRSFAKGGEPCRDVLRCAMHGEEIILASYCPFTQAGPYKEYGPVFVLAKHSHESVDMYRLPLPIGGVDSITKAKDSNDRTPYLGDNFILKGYSSDEWIIDAKLATPLTVDSIITAFLEKPEITFVMARYTAFGCYSFCFERE
jgi:hypothetical protein